MLTTFTFVFLNEFCWNVCEFNVDIFRVGHWGIKVEVFGVNGTEVYACAREHALKKQLDEFKGHGVGSNITRESDAIAANGDAGAIRIVLIRPHFTYHHGVAKFLLFKNHNLPSFVAFVDLVKAYDTADNDHLLKILEKYGAPPKFVAAIRTMYTNLKVVLKIDQEIQEII
jgi:hypothetical protein